MRTIKIGSLAHTGKDMDEKYRETARGGLAAIYNCPV